MVSALHVHLVFVTKYRRDVLTEEILRRTEEVLQQICDDFKNALVEFNGKDDHVHLLIEYPPKIPIAKLVNALKGVSSRRLRDEFTRHVNRHSMHGHFWSPSYFAGSCGDTPLSVIHQYIEDQHRPPRSQNRPKLTR